MKRLMGSVLAGCLAPALAAAQAAGGGAGDGTREAIGIQVEVLEGLDAMVDTEALGSVAQLVPRMRGQGGGIDPAELEDREALMAALRAAAPPSTGVVISTAMVGPDGRAAGGATVSTSSPAWMLGPAIAGGTLSDADAEAAMRLFGDVLWRDGEGYYFYVNVAACGV